MFRIAFVIVCLLATFGWGYYALAWRVFQPSSFDVDMSARMHLINLRHFKMQIEAEESGRDWPEHIAYFKRAIALQTNQAGNQFLNGIRFDRQRNLYLYLDRGPTGVRLGKVLSDPSGWPRVLVFDQAMDMHTYYNDVSFLSIRTPSPDIASLAVQVRDKQTKEVQTIEVYAYYRPVMKSAPSFTWQMISYDYFGLIFTKAMTAKYEVVSESPNVLRWLEPNQGHEVSDKCELVLGDHVPR